MKPSPRKKLLFLVSFKNYAVFLGYLWHKPEKELIRAFKFRENHIKWFG
jgi:hypothetical protein